MSKISLIEQFGQIDIYLFDQLLKGRIRSEHRILDAGCGGGRNLVYLMREGFDVYGVDANSRAVAGLPPDRFRAEPIEQMSFDDAFFEVVISSAVLHMARDQDQFNAMLQGMWRVLKPGGLFFCRLASSIGMENQVRAISGRRHALPDGSERYLVDAELLEELTESLGGELLDPMKTTVVQNQRSMTTWVVQKNR